MIQMCFFFFVNLKLIIDFTLLDGIFLNIYIYIISFLIMYSFMVCTPEVSENIEHRQEALCCVDEL